MNRNESVPLVRRFSSVSRSEGDSDEQDVLALLGYKDFTGWPEIDKAYRSVVLAEAGAGKTFEMLARAKFVADQGHFAFYIRIEDIDGEFEQAFEVGSAETLRQWRDSQTDAWFYLDSVDEARLSNPRTFENAIRRFSTRIKSAKSRAHVCISSRPYAWRPKSDGALIERWLRFKKPETEPTDKSGPGEPSQNSECDLAIFLLRPMDQDEIRFFAEHRSAPQVERFITELERLNLMGLAGRPFDLNVILDKWFSDQTLGGQTELLRHNIELRLDEWHPDRARRQPLNKGIAREGARRLAAAVILTGTPGIRVPDNSQEWVGINAEAVLADWKPIDVQTLLERAIFNDVIYGAVRFRHREVRELLAAEWFAELLQQGNSRHAIEALVFREQYGEQIISPRLRPILPWLILDDDNIRTRTLSILPEIALEGGDPARLPLPERKRILVDIVCGIVRDNGSGATGDNSAIARIAQPDLTGITLNLINQFADNDGAIFFLARLVWQGEMTDCVSPLIDIAANPGRGVYARIAASRAIMTCGTDEQKATLWNSLLAAGTELHRKLLADLIQQSPTDSMSVPRLLESINRLPPYDRFKSSGLTDSLHGFISRLPISRSRDSHQPLATLVSGLHAILDRPPYIEHAECRVSKDFAWLLRPAIHAVERLVSARAQAGIQSHATAIMLNYPAAREFHDLPFSDYKVTLGELVPAWPELNDALFWQRVKAARTQLENDGKRLDDYWQVQSPPHYWYFGPDSFPRVIEWVKLRELQDDRLIALSLAFRIYAETEEPSESLHRLQVAVKDDAVLLARLDRLLAPVIYAEERKWQKAREEHRQNRERRRREKEQLRSEWVARLKTNPDLVRNSPRLQPGEVSNDQAWLLAQIKDSGVRTSLSQGADWQSLVDEFGIDVARAYRDAAILHWRNYTPGLRSEGDDTRIIHVPLDFAMAGLEIESREIDKFPAHLDKAELRHALRYITREINGFPSWLEAVHQTHPQAVLRAIQTELFWELANTKPDQPMHYILQNLVHSGPWIHVSLVEPLVTWVAQNPLPSPDVLCHCLHILKSGGVDPAELTKVAQAKVQAERFSQDLPYWYALWVDADPDTGVVAVSTWLGELDLDESSHAAQVFITSLIGPRQAADSGPNIGHFLTARHLKSLYLLMHKHIRAKNDIKRAEGRSYSPELRDHAQDARERLFYLLCEIPGNETYVALADLTQVHPNPTLRPWIGKGAYNRAEVDGDLEPWTAEQVCEFGSKLTRTPATNRQLFDLTVNQLTDLKIWLEQGDDSLYFIWQRAKTENEMRKLVARGLNQTWGNRYTTAQESELANSQRVDIWLQNPNVPFPVPIELKMLDKSWSGPKLCERLRNQLAGDYLREGTERYGLMLLVWKGPSPPRQWQISGRRVRLSGLRNALKEFWVSISTCFPNVAALEIIVIDLSLRNTRSNQ